jgi:hypothetical protein
MIGYFFFHGVPVAKALIDDEEKTDGLWFAFPFDVACCFLVAILFFQGRYNKMRDTVKVLGEQDMVKYHKQWDDMTSRPGAKEDLAALSEAWNAAMAAAPRSAKRQPSVRGGPKKCLTNMIVHDPKISEVFAIADAVNPELQRKAAEWAAKSECVPHTGHGPGPEKRAIWPVPVKSTPRALDKVYRSYDEDCGRLCDLCRVSMVYSDLAGVKRGLETILQDPEAEVQWCKDSKMRFRESKGKAGGYRDVQLSVKCRTPKLKEMGQEYEGHRCEVQLHLLEFYTLKNSAGHGTYTRIRNMMY